MIAIVTLTTLLASWRPSHQAARVDPVQLLREE
jgi:ABC-type lipoprotein release transport system permease subunit